MSKNQFFDRTKTMPSKCIQCRCKINSKNLVKKMCISGFVYPRICVYICRSCATCVNCDRICFNRPIQYLKPGTLIRKITIDDKWVKVCYSLPYVCLKCHPCPICKKGIKFSNDDFHQNCLFIMMCRGTFEMQNVGQTTIFSVFPKDLLKYLLSFFKNLRLLYATKCSVENM
jgi:hypothetical protein